MGHRNLNGEVAQRIRPMPKLVAKPPGSGHTHKREDSRKRGNRNDQSRKTKRTITAKNAPRRF